MPALTRCLSISALAKNSFNLSICSVSSGFSGKASHCVVVWNQCQRLLGWCGPNFSSTLLMNMEFADEGEDVLGASAVLVSGSIVVNVESADEGEGVLGAFAGLDFGSIVVHVALNSPSTLEPNEVVSSSFSASLLALSKVNCNRAGPCSTLIGKAGLWYFNRGRCSLCNILAGLVLLFHCWRSYCRFKRVNCGNGGRGRMAAPSPCRIANSCEDQHRHTIGFAGSY